ncbi:acyl-CoA dehydrogenase family protein [Candidatus Riflebacteria bacterium]
MNFDLSPDQKMIQEMARDFARSKIKPVAMELDKNHTYPAEIIKAMAELGLMGMNIPEEYGGAGVDNVAYALAIIEISKACSSVAVTTCVNHLVCDCLNLFGSQQQKEKFLTPLASGETLGSFCLTEPQAGSDAQNQKTSAKKEGNSYRLNGTKTFITNGTYAGVFIVTAVTSAKDAPKKEISAFIVEKGVQGLHIGAAEEKLGQCASNTVEISLEDVIVAEENLIGGENGFKVMMKGLNSGRIGIAALSCGIAEAALQLAITYAKEREAFGGTLARIQAIQFKIAQMATQLESSRLLTLKAAYLKDRGEPFMQEASMAKLAASEACNKITYEALQIHGGYGCVKEYEVEKLFRDARVTTIYEGTSEIQKLVIARQLLR